MRIFQTKEKMEYFGLEPGPKIFIPKGTRVKEVYETPQHIEAETLEGETISISRGSKEALNLKEV